LGVDEVGRPKPIREVGCKLLDSALWKIPECVYSRSDANSAVRWEILNLSVSKKRPARRFTVSRTANRHRWVGREY